MTLTLTPEIERAIGEAARLRGLTPEQEALDRLYASLALPTTPQNLLGPTVMELSAMSHAERVRAIKGSSAHLGPSRLADDREEEKTREERRWQS